MVLNNIETVPIRLTLSVIAKRMSIFSGWQKSFDCSPNYICNFGVKCAHNGIASIGGAFSFTPTFKQEKYTTNGGFYRCGIPAKKLCAYPRGLLENT